MTHSRWIRLALGYMAFFSLSIGPWALFAPQSFYDSFPGSGTPVISIDGPYNEHLIRDVGALNLAMLVLIVWAAVTLSRQLVTVAAVASMAWGVPHVIYHVFNTKGLSGSDLASNIGGLVLFAALPVVIIVIGRKHLDVA